MSVARAYARALFETATAAKSSSQEIQNLETELGAILAAIESSKEARSALFGPVMPVRDKQALLEGVSKKMNASPLIPRFLGLLARKGRLPLLRKIQGAFAAVRVEAEGGIIGTVVAADPVGAGDVESLAKAFGKKLNK